MAVARASFVKTIRNESYPAISPTRPELSQAGKTVLITGGSIGIGYAIATGFAEAGVKRIIIIGRRKHVNVASAAKLHAAYPHIEVEGREGDIGDLQSTEELWADLAEKKIFVDILVLNAVKYPKPKSLLELGRDGVWDNLTVNVRSVMDYTERFHKQPNGEKRPKVLINVSSVAIHNFKTAPLPNYSLAKNAQTLLLQLVADETSPEEMQIVSFHPGAIFTEAAEKYGLTVDSLPWDNGKEPSQVVFLNLPGNFAVWAASPEARFLHGRFVWAAWDVDEMRKGFIREQIDNDDCILRIGVVGVKNDPPETAQIPFIG